MLQEEADCDRSVTGAEDEDGDNSDPNSSSSASHTPSPTQHVKTTCWWAPRLKAHLSSHAHALDSMSENLHPRVLLSACSGSCAEAEALTAPRPGMRGKDGVGRQLILSDKK